VPLSVLMGIARGALNDIVLAMLISIWDVSEEEGFSEIK
jgi:hypothetical protein